MLYAGSLDGRFLGTSWCSRTGELASWKKGLGLIASPPDEKASEYVLQRELLLTHTHTRAVDRAERRRVGIRVRRGPDRVIGRIEELPTELDPLPKLDSAVAICKWIAQLAEEVHAGRLDPKVALSLTQMARLQGCHKGGKPVPGGCD